MEAKVTISFPCSEEDWQKLCNMRAMFSHTGTTVSNQESSDESPLLDALDNEKRIFVESESKDTHITTPLPTKISRILDLIHKNPGLTRANIAKLAMNTYSDISYKAAYTSINDLYLHGKIDESLIKMRTYNKVGFKPGFNY